jgi:hypothetical protein
VFDRLAEFERSRDENARVYHFIDDLSGAADAGGVGSILVLLNFVVPRFRLSFLRNHI